MSQVTTVSQFVPSQLPQHVLESGSLLPDFLETYYEYVDQRTKGGGLIFNHEANLDIDRTLPEYINKFYAMHGDKIPVDIAMDRRKFLKLLNQIYDAKGTAKAYRLLFRGLFGEEIDISYPGERVLRSSDGRWVQQSFVSVEATGAFTTASIPSAPFSMIVESEDIDYEVRVDSVEILDSTHVRFFFASSSKIKISANQEIVIYNNNDEAIFGGQARSVPSKIKITDGGMNWKLGQIFRLIGSNVDTLCKVTAVDPGGVCSSAEIIAYGWFMQENCTFVVSPHRGKPPGTTTQLVTNIVSESPLVYDFDMTITDGTNFTSEEILGYKWQKYGEGTAYFETDYLVLGYLVYEVISNASQTFDVQIANIDYGLTIEEWRDSLMNLTLENQVIVKTKGYYKTEDGLISHQSIRLQDNFYYQAFSYLIDTTVSIGNYTATLNVLHPAGTKRFVNLNKTFTDTLSYTTSTEVSVG